MNNLINKLQNTIIYYDEFPMNDIIGFENFNGKSKYRFFYDKDNYLEIINIMANSYDEMITWQYKNKYFIFTSLNQIETFCSVAKITTSINYSNQLENSFIRFLIKDKLLFSKVTNKRIRKCQIWLAEKIKKQWYDINVIYDNSGNISFSFFFNNRNYSIII